MPLSGTLDSPFEGQILPPQKPPIKCFWYFSFNGLNLTA